MQGIAFRKKPLSCKWIGAGSLKLVQSELDYEIILGGLVRQVDAKTFQNTETMRHSWITPHQAETARWYMDQGVKSGYVVWFRDSNNVVFFDGYQLTNLQKGESLHWNAGEYLGGFETFCLGNLFL